MTVHPLRLMSILCNITNFPTKRVTERCFTITPAFS